MSLGAYVLRGVSRILHDPRKLRLLLEGRVWRHFYWMARYGLKSDLHESRWSFSGDFARRTYRSYDEYKSHQASKIEGAFRSKLEALEEQQYAGFVRRFALCPEIVGQRSVLCLGARLGTEVRALRAMGFFAVGIDLNPGPGNPHVHYGDFHKLAFGDDTVDVVYTNVLDHAYDLAKVTAEIRRVLRPGGIALLELIRGTSEGYLPQEYESMAWKTARGFAEHLAQLGGLQLEAFRTADEIGDPYWNQAILVKR